MVILEIALENPDELLATGAFGAGALIRLESGSAVGGPFAEIQTIAIVAATTAYLAYDQAGTTTTWYRYRISNAGASVFGAYNTPWQGGVAQTIGSLDDLRRAIGQTNPADLSDDEDLLKILGWITGLIHIRTQRYFLPDPPTGDGTFLFDYLPYAGRLDPNVRFDGTSMRIRRGIRYITKLEIASYTNGPFFTIDPLDYFVRPNIQERDAGWPGDELCFTDFPQIVNPPSQYLNFNPGRGTTRLTGGLGFAAPPPEIEEISIAASVRWWAAKQAGQIDTVGPTEMGRPMISRVFSIDEKITLDSYRDRGAR